MKALRIHAVFIAFLTNEAERQTQIRLYIKKIKF